MTWAGASGGRIMAPDAAPGFRRPRDTRQAAAETWMFLPPILLSVMENSIHPTAVIDPRATIGRHV